MSTYEEQVTLTRIGVLINTTIKTVDRKDFHKIILKDIVKKSSIYVPWGGVGVLGGGGGGGWWEVAMIIVREEIDRFK